MAAPKRRQRSDKAPGPAGRKPTSGRQKRSGEKSSPASGSRPPKAGKPSVGKPAADRRRVNKPTSRTPTGEGLQDGVSGGVTNTPPPATRPGDHQAADSRRGRVRDLKHQRADLAEKKRLHEAKRATRSLRQQPSPAEGPSPAGTTGGGSEPGGDDWRGVPDQRTQDAHERPRRHGSEWIYGRNVAKLVRAPGSRRRVQAVAATASALHTIEGSIDLNGLDQRIATTEELDQLTGTHEHQGVALRVPVFHYAQLEELFETGLIVVLDEVTDPRNVGAVARSVLASGAGGLVLPSHRSAAVTPAAVKASAGATEHLPIAQVTNVVAALTELKQHGFWVYGTSSEARISYRQLDYGGKVALVFGSEGRGLRPLVARTCDALAAIPVKPPMASLNISVAAALFLYEARRARDVQGAQGQSEQGASRERKAPSD